MIPYVEGEGEGAATTGTIFGINPVAATVAAMTSDFLSVLAASNECDVLAPDADEETRIRMTERFAPAVAQAVTDYPWLVSPTEHVPKSL